MGRATARFVEGLIQVRRWPNQAATTYSNAKVEGLKQWFSRSTHQGFRDGRIKIAAHEHNTSRQLRWFLGGQKPLSVLQDRSDQSYVNTLRKSAWRRVFMLCNSPPREHLSLGRSAADIRICARGQQKRFLNVIIQLLMVASVSHHAIIVQSFNVLYGPRIERTRLPTPYFLAPNPTALFLDQSNFPAA